MSLVTLRDGLLSARRSDAAASLRKRSSKLRALNAVTAAITHHVGLTPSLDVDFDAIPSPPLTPSESQLLDRNDLTKGRCFDDATLTASLQDIEAVSPFKSQSQQAVKNQQPINEYVTVDSAAASKANSHTDDTDEAKPPLDPVKDPQPDGSTIRSELRRASSGPIKPSDVVKKHPEHGPKTVHLPPKEVQEERMRARRQSRDDFRAAQLREAESHPVEPASSPSSTVGAWSTTTPMPADPSPVTSVGEENVVSADRLENKSLDSAPLNGDVAPKQEQTIVSHAQTEAAPGNNPVQDLASPDVQLRLEQEQAVNASRDAAAITPPATADAIEQTHAPSAPKHPNKPPVTEQARPVPVLTDPVVKADPARPAHAKEPSCEHAQPSGHAPSSDAVADRMTTRVSSGTSRQKSDSEIVGEAPKANPGVKRPSLSETVPSTSSVKVTTAVENNSSIDTSRLQRAKVEQDVDRSDSQAKRHSHLPVSCEGYEALRGASEDPTKDYLEPLFRMQTHDNLPINKTLAELLTRSNKAVSTADQFAGIHERQDHRILRRIYALQNANKWSLRQMQPCAEPEPPKTHMDYLISEMKWMRTDFRQERKMKKELAKYLAEECADWVNADPITRLSKQVEVRMVEESKPTSNAPHSPATTNFENGEQHSQDASSLPDLEPTNEQDDSSIDDADSPRTPLSYVVPKSVFPAMDMGKDNAHFLDSDQILDAFNELPLYVPFEDEPDQPEAIVQRPVPSISRYCEEKIMIKIPSPIKKRSRYNYDEDEDDLLSQVPQVKRVRAKDGAGIPPEQTDVALFDPENKLLRDRLHSNTAFRPPSEFPMPSSQFYEFRTSSQWIAEDDQLLRRLAKEYSFNWSLIADEMSLPSQMSGAADRRTPWECFERWVELESLPNEMRKTLYFKTWNQRIEAAQRNNDMRYQQNLAQQSQNPNQPQNIQRRRTQPVRVEKRRTTRYLHVVDAMRKNARKREQHAHKQAEAQKAASLRKQHESTAPKSAMHSPAEFSRLRHERDVAYAQRQEQYRQQVLERQRQAAMQQRTGQQFNSQQVQPGHQSANQQRPANAPQVQPGQPQQAGNNQMQQAPQGQVPRGNAHLAVPQMGMQGNIPPQAQMQANMRNTNTAANHGMSDNMQQRIALEQAHRQATLKQQAQMGGQQYQMGPPNRVSPGGAHVPNGMMNGQSNPAIMAAMQQSGNQHAPTPNGAPMQQSFNGHPNTTTASASPHMPPPPNPAQPQQQAQQSQQPQQQQPQQLSSGLVPAITQITHQLQAKHPHATPDQIKELTSQHLKQFYSQQQTQQARQSAMHAAAGINGVSQSPNQQAAYSQNQNGVAPVQQAPYNHGQNQNQAAFQQNSSAQQANGHPSNNNNGTMNGHPTYNNNGNNVANGVGNSPNVQYANAMRQQLIQQRQSQIQSAAVANSSPHVAHASPNMAHASPNMAQAVPNMNGAANRTPTPQMTRLGSSNGQPVQGQLQSPGMQQSSPRAVPAGVSQRQ